VTYGDVAAVYIVMALTPSPALFLVEAGLPDISVVDDPPFTHTYPHGHPTIRFEGVVVAARGCGAMLRLLGETTAWAVAREQGGTRIIDHQGVRSRSWTGARAGRRSRAGSST